MPTTLAARSRAEIARHRHQQQATTTRRFEDFDFDEGSIADGDDTFVGGAGGGRRSNANGNGDGTGATTARKPRRTLNEEADESGFIFTRISQQKQREQPPPQQQQQPDPSSSSSSRQVVTPPPQPSSSRTVTETLPSDRLGETPINQKNRLYRSGLGTPAGKPRRPSAGLPHNNRRSSLNFKEARQSSSMREASNSYPHPGIPDKELHRHISAATPPAVRMKILADWAFDRARADVLAGLPSEPQPPKTKRARKDDATTANTDKDSPWTAQERKILERCRATLEKVMLDSMRDLQDGKVSVTWSAGAGAATDQQHAQPAKQRRPNPENTTNIALAQTLTSQADALRAENAKWEEETRRIEAYEAETAALVKAAVSASTSSSTSSSATSPPSSSSHAALGWDNDDLDAESAQMMDLARQALAADDDWAEATKTAVASSDTATAPPHLQGTDLDPRWRSLAFNADAILSQTHLLDQLLQLSTQYTDTTSSRAAHTLRRLAFGEMDSSAGASGTANVNASDPTQSSSNDSSDARNAQRARQERILSGISMRDGPSLIPGDADDAAARPSSPPPPAHRIKEDADQSAVDLFRAFARTGSEKPQPQSAKGVGVGLAAPANVGATTSSTSSSPSKRGRPRKSQR